MGSNEPRIVLFVGSTRRGGCARLAERAYETLSDLPVRPELLSLQRLHVKPCRNCDGCFKNAQCVIKDDDGDLVLKKLAQADGLLMFSPVFFAGPPAQLKAVYDRFQPHYAERYEMHVPMRRKRPAHLIVVGAGKDPFGYEPAVTIARSALNVANFATRGVDPFIGINPLDPGEEALGRMADIARRFADTVIEDHGEKLREMSG